MKMHLRLKTVLITGLAALVVALPATAGDSPTLEPGGELTFDLPDEDPAFAFQVFFGATCATLSGIPGGFSGSCLLAFAPGARGSCELIQYNDFYLSPGAMPDTIVMGHITGEVDANGFLVLIGLGQLKAELVVKLIDLGEDLLSADDDSVVATRTIAQHEILNEQKLGLGITVNAQAGGATAVQVGAEVTVELGLSACLKIIRESIQFDMDVPLRRGHHYRLQVGGESSVQLTQAGGLAKAAFHSDFNLPDNVFDTANWFDSSALPFKNWELPDVDLTTLSLFKFPELIMPAFLGVGPFTILPELIIPIIPFGSTNELLMSVGIPTTLQELIDSSAFANLGIDLGDPEPILNAGVQFKSMTVSIARDPLEEALLHQIEENLARHDHKETLYKYQLPAEHGGYLEIARSIVMDAMDAMTAAGQDIHKADKYLAKGDLSVDVGDFKAAYHHFRIAYRKATQK